MLYVEIRGLKELQQRVDDTAKKHVPFATALALTRTAGAAKEKTVREMQQKLHMPTDYTLNSLFVKPATKSKLWSMVYVKDFGRISTGKRSGKVGKSQAEVLGHLFTGGNRAEKGFERVLHRMGLLPDGMSIVPGEGAPLDGNGNIPNGFYMQMMSYFKMNMSSNDWMTDKSRGRFENRLGKKLAGNVQFFVSRGTGNWFGRGAWRYGRMQNLPPGIWQRVSYGHGGSSIKPVIMFVRKPTYRKYFNLEIIAKTAVDERYAIEFNNALSYAMETAR